MIGCDLLDARRLEGIFKRHKERWIHRILTPLEQKEALLKKSPLLRYAKLFSLKESAVKAIGTLTYPHWKDFEVSHDVYGKPHMQITGDARKHIPYENFTVHITTSDEGYLVLSYVWIQPIF